MTYGKKVLGLNDPYVRLVETVSEGSNKAALPGAWWVEFFPFLRHIPDWVPGIAFKRFIQKYIPLVKAMRDRPFDEVLAAIVSLRRDTITVMNQS